MASLQKMSSDLASIITSIAKEMKVGDVKFFEGLKIGQNGVVTGKIGLHCFSMTRVNIDGIPYETLILSKEEISDMPLQETIFIQYNPHDNIGIITDEEGNTKFMLPEYAIKKVLNEVYGKFH